MRRQAPDLILLDVKMPGMSGFDFCRKLKESPEWKNIPVVFLTSKDEPVNKVLGFELKGAAGPVVLWVMCFLVIVLGGHVLWDKAGLHAEPHILPSNSDASSITPAPSSNDSGK